MKVIQHAGTCPTQALYLQKLQQLHKGQGPKSHSISPFRRFIPQKKNPSFVLLYLISLVFHCCSADIFRFMHILEAAHCEHKHYGVKS